MNINYSDIITRISRYPIIATGTETYAGISRMKRCCRTSNVITPANTARTEDCSPSPSPDKECTDCAPQEANTANVKNAPEVACPALPANSYSTVAFIADGSASKVPDKGVFRLSANKVSDNIGYSPATGIFTINDAGMYYVSWNIATVNASQTHTALSAAFDQLTPSNAVIAKSSSVSKAKPGEGITLTGSAIFTATAGAEFAFINNTGSDIILSPNEETATNVVVFKIS